MKKEFNNPGRAKELNLGIIQAGEQSVIRVDIKDIPEGYTVEDFIELIKKEGIALVDAPRQTYEYYPLYAMGQVLSDYKGRKIYIIDTLDTQYYYRDFDNLESRYYEDFRVIDTHYCLDSDIELYREMRDKLGDARVKDN